MAANRSAALLANTVAVLAAAFLQTAATETATETATATAIAAPVAHAATDDDIETTSEINIDAPFLFDWGNAPGTGPYFAANNIDAATQITTAALMGGACIVVFSMLRMRWPELYSHRLRLRNMRPSNIPRTLLGWMYPVVTMSDRHVLETIGLDAVLFFRAYRMFIYMFFSLAVLGMVILYPVNLFWSREYLGDDESHTVFDSPISYVPELSGRYSVAHVFLAYAFAAIIYFYIDRFALHAITMRWHYLLLTRRSGNSRTLMVTRLPRELRTTRRLARFVQGMGVGAVESVHIPPADSELNDALKARASALQSLEAAYTAYLGNPCRARTYDPALLKRVVLAEGADARDVERRLLFRWARRRKQQPIDRPRTWVTRKTALAHSDFQLRSNSWWPPLVRVDAIDHWRSRLTAADQRLKAARDSFARSPAGAVGFVTMRRPVDAYILSQLSVHAQPSACSFRMAPEARAVVWRNVARPQARRLLRLVVGLLMTIALLFLWCVPVILISTLISLRFLVTRVPGLVDVVNNNKFVRSLLGYTLPSLILTIFMTILPRLLWSFVLVGGDRSFAEADKNMLIRHMYFLVIYIVIIFGMSGSVWSSIYNLFTDFGGFWDQLVAALPQMASWYCVYVMLYGAGYQVMKLLHLKSVCRFLFFQARARTPRDYMRAISPVYIDWGTFQPYTILFFLIGILYAHLQPLLLPMTVLYFLVGLFVMKYMCVYAWYFRHQSAGAIWPVIVRRMVVCVMLYQALTTAVFASANNHWFVAPMIVLMLFSWYYFWVRCKYLRQLSEAVPLQLLREAERRRAAVLASERADLAARLQGRKEGASQQDRDAAAAAAVATTSVAWADGARCEAARMDTPECDVDDPISPSTALCADSVGCIGATGSSSSTKPRRRGVRRFVERIISLVLDTLIGDPAAPLWAHIDDYAFPERVDRAMRPAGRSEQDPHMSKMQPGSLIDIAWSTIRGIPRGLRAIGSEYFLGFSVPRAYLDTSVAEYPRVRNTEDAFKSGRSLRRRKKQNQDDGISDSAAEESSASEQSDGNDGGDQESLLLRARLRSMSGGDADFSSLGSSSVANFCLAPDQSASARRGAHLLETADAGADEISADEQLLSGATPRPSAPPLPAVGGPRLHRASTFVALYDSRTGKPTAMQYQAQSTELPHGTHMNRKKTDFSQANMAHLPGVLDSTQFSYLHPGMYGDLPSLWLPVASLKHRKQARKSARQLLRDAFDAVEDAIGDNFIGEKNMTRLQGKRRDLKSHALRRLSSVQSGLKFAGTLRSRSSSLSISSRDPIEKQRQQPPLADESLASPSLIQLRQLGADEASSMQPPLATGADDLASMTPSELQAKVEDMHVESQCRALGIDPAVVREWDPTGLHHCISSANMQGGPFSSGGRNGSGAQVGPESSHDPAALFSAGRKGVARLSSRPLASLSRGSDSASINNKAPGDDDTDTVPASDGESSSSDNDINDYDAYNDTQQSIAAINGGGGARLQPASGASKSRHRRLPTIVSIISAPLQRFSSNNAASRPDSSQQQQQQQQSRGGDDGNSGSSVESYNDDGEKPQELDRRVEEGGYHR
ncbi:hypothetical protein GGI11_000109 [Coemansia sp. RSA 2049]|nr:hypothetical protein GGI11_000109 [Coemansia sp. RSA 2049]